MGIEENILRFDIAMRDIVCMGISESLSYLEHNLEGIMEF